MKKILLILLLLQTSYIGFAQTDSVKKRLPKYKFGNVDSLNKIIPFLSLGISSGVLGGGGGPVGEHFIYEQKYIDYLYLNSISARGLLPLLEIGLNTNVWRTNFGFGMMKFNKSPDFYIFSQKQKWFYFETNRIFLKRKVKPYIGVKVSYLNQDMLLGYYNGSSYSVSRIVSNLLDLRTPIGLLIGKKRVKVDIQLDLLQSAYVVGKFESKIVNSSLFHGGAENMGNFKRFLNPVNLMTSNFFLNRINICLVYNATK
ncbi:MAG: hypothetical protein RI955_1626 [Bacteroidota bacterium]|jgi:hypothetical protein